MELQSKEIKLGQDKRVAIEWEKSQISILIPKENSHKIIGWVYNCQP